MFDELKEKFPALWHNSRFTSLTDDYFTTCLTTLTNAGVKHTEAVRAAADAAYNKVVANFIESNRGQVPFFQDKSTWDKEMGYWCTIAQRLRSDAFIGWLRWLDNNSPVGCEAVAQLIVELEEEGYYLAVGVSTPEGVTESLSNYDCPLIDCCLTDAEYLYISVENYFEDISPRPENLKIKLDDGTVYDKMKEIVEGVKKALNTVSI